MARYTDAACKLCRREGQKLFLKGERCYTRKCAVERRSYAPGSTVRDVKKVFGIRQAAGTKQWRAVITECWKSSSPLF